jgi:DNA-binding NtrC family response regulator
VDLHSTNGTLVDGMSVLDCFLRGGELIRVGETTLKLERHDDAPGVQLAVADRFGKLVGESVEMRRLYPLCSQLAASDVPVLIEGETGTGKEVLAESLHREGGRANGPFMVFDCTAVPPSLVEAELFGYEDRVYGDRAGVFEQAEGGTLLIDEIADLGLSLQPRLLRAIERREVQRVGATGFRPINVRVICASRRDLDQAVQTQRFRDDLFHRLAVGRIELPPLRDRLTDIPVLAAEFARELGSREPLSKLLLDDWMSMSWPGNVRELRSAVARYLAMGAYSSAISSDPGTEKAPGTADLIREVLDLPLSEARQRVIDEFERQYIERLLVKHRGNVTRAAAAAGVVRRHFQTLKARALKTDV